MKQKIIIKLFQFFNKFSKNRFFRKYFFLAQNQNKFILTKTKEIFVVNTSDKAIAKDLFVTGEFEYANIEKAYNIIKKKYKNISNYTLLDIGANIGSICIPTIVRKVLKKVIAIEPSLRSLQLLKVNTILNKVDDNIEYICSLVGKNKKNLNFLLSEDNHGDNKVVTKKIKNSIKANSISLDYLTNKYKNKFIIKIDVQGHEGIVLSNGKRTLSKKLPLILELYPFYINLNKSFNKILNPLLVANYEYFYDLSEINPKKIAFNKKTILIKYNNLKKLNNFTDLLFI